MNPVTNPGKPFKKLGCFIVPAILLTVLIPIWFFFIAPEIRHNRLVKKGIPVPGRLLSVDETGTYINDAPEIELVVTFTRKDGTPDTATTEFVPTLRTLHMYQPEANVTIAYDPEEPDEITIISVGGPGRPERVEPTNSDIESFETRRTIDSLKRQLDSVTNRLRRTEGLDSAAR